MQWLNVSFEKLVARPLSQCTCILSIYRFCTSKHVHNPFPNKPCFLHVCSTYLLKISAISTNLKLSSANSFSLEEFKICRLGKGLSF